MALAVAQIWLFRAVMLNCLQHIMQVLLAPATKSEFDAMLGTVIHNINETYIHRTHLECFTGSPILCIQ
ncbi:hypothetical protein CesoFtcFv8_010663 [Champsocephalus esox]|uniref:Secreted protein n=1 Tax=Champsocephalus esox TaxID=159716 RepID=A0AAN8C516_9TELE|nr:hypothetical protein CesoFtcFv8_010663 [Champsocephalus esox]